MSLLTTTEHHEYSQRTGAGTQKAVKAIRGTQKNEEQERVC